jgi:hypothetical protein
MPAIARGAGLMPFIPGVFNLSFQLFIECLPGDRPTIACGS